MKQLDEASLSAQDKPASPPPIIAILGPGTFRVASAAIGEKASPAAPAMARNLRRE